MFYRYTYGQPVKGTVEASVCVKESTWFWDFRRPEPRDTNGTNEGTYCTLVEEPVSVARSIGFCFECICSTFLTNEF